MDGSVFENVQAQHTPCSWNECRNGHRWPPTLILAKCPGCSGPMLAIRQENCLYCNEPVIGMSLRADFIPVGIGGIAARCRNVKPPGETVDLCLERHAWQEAEGAHLTFEAKREKENGQ